MTYKLVRNYFDNIERVVFGQPGAERAGTSATFGWLPSLDCSAKETALLQ